MYPTGFLRFLTYAIIHCTSEIFSSSFAAAAYFEQNPLPAGKKIYIIGQEGIGEELDLLNIPHFGANADAGKVIKLAPGISVNHVFQH